MSTPAAHVVHIDKMHFHRFSSTPLENNAVIAQWNPKQEYMQFWGNNGFPTIGLQLLAPALGVWMDQIRYQTYDVGAASASRSPTIRTWPWRRWPRARPAVGR